MKLLKTLIKLNKKKLDDLVKQVNNLEEQKNLLTISLQELKEQILIENTVALNMHSCLIIILNGAEENEKKLKTQVKQFEEQIAVAVLREQLAEQ